MYMSSSETEDEEMDYDYDNEFPPLPPPASHNPHTMKSPRKIVPHRKPPFVPYPKLRKYTRIA